MFNAGDKIILTHDINCDDEIHSFYKGDIAKVLYNNPRFQFYKLEWNKTGRDFHDASGLGKQGHCWNIDKKIINKKAKLYIGNKNDVKYNI